MNDDKRPFGVWTATAMVVGCMVGAGIFVLPVQLAPFGWTGALTWLIAAAGTMLIAVVVVSLTKAMPEEPSILTISGRALGTEAGVLIGWSQWISVCCSNATVATTVALYLASYYPPLAATPLRAGLFGSAIVIALTLVNLRGARDAGRLQVLTVLIKLMPLLAVVAILAVLALEPGGLPHRAAMAPLAMDQLSPALGLAFYAMLGFEAASLVTQRVRDPARNILRATLGGVAAISLIYLVVCTGMIMALPADALATAQAPFALFFETHVGSSAALVVAALAATSGIGYLNGTVFALGEIPLGFVRAGQLPGWLARTNSRDVAIAPILIGAALTIALMLGATTRGGADVLEFMLLLTVTAGLWIYLGACAAALVLGKARIASALGTAFCLWVAWGTGLEAVLWGVALLAAGLPLYWLARRDRLSSAAASGSAGDPPG